MSHFIDRRLNGKNKSTVNRGRFIRRYKEQLKRSVAEAVNRRSITDMDSGEKVGIPSRDISEPIFHHGPGGTRDMVHPGNKEFLPGDRIRRPEGEGAGSGQGSASNSGRGEDDFVFELSREEFMDLLFDDLELPNLVRNQLVGIHAYTRWLHNGWGAGQHRRGALAQRGRCQAHCPRWAPPCTHS